MTRTEAHFNDELTGAISNGDLEQITTLLNESSSLFSTAPALHPLLALASEKGSAPIVSLLLSHGAKVDVDAIVSAFATVNVAVFQAFLDSGFNINTHLGHIGDILILSLRSPAVLTWALAHGADPNANRSGMRSALDLAVINGSTETVEALIAAGAHIKNTNALKVAAYYGRNEMIELLLTKGAEINEIPDYPQMAKSERDDGLGTALHAAAEAGHVPAVKLLLQKGADLSLKNSRGKTALELAQEKNYAHVVEVLASRYEYIQDE
ncbi:hypothetical protein C0991_008009 [Blastosporella zonata]|nr:hypothetical protein C0991_008009 [Blastosporella zonata]